MLAVEFAAVRMWLNSVSIAHTSPFIDLVTLRGPGTFRFVAVRVVVAFAMVSLIFGESRMSDRRWRAEAFVRHGIERSTLLAHLCLLLVFAGLSSMLFGARPTGGVEIALTTLWLVTGVTSCVVLALAFMPAAFWSSLLRSMSPLLTFAVVVSIGAYALGRLALILWQPLSRGTLGVAYAMLHPFISGLSTDPSTFTIGTPDFQVLIGAECSGYEGLGLMLVFTSGWLWLHRAEWRFPHALMLVPVSLAAIWIINCVRVAGLLLIGIAGARDIAVGGFHSQAGWLGFTIAALGICLTARRVTWLKSDARVRTIGGAASNPTAAFLMPFLAILAGAMMAQLGSASFEWLYPLRVVACAGTLVYFSRSYRSLNWQIGWPSIALGSLAFVIWVGLEPLAAVGPVSTPIAFTQAPITWRMAWLTFRVLGAVVTVPIAEELAFRGFLMRRFVAENFEAVSWQSVSWIAFTLASVAFGVLHGERWIAGTIAGVIYGAALLRRGSIGEAIVAHATTNALIAMWVLFGGHWQLW